MKGQAPPCPQATGPGPLPIPLCTGRQGGLPERGSEPSSPVWPPATAPLPWPQCPQLCSGDGHSCLGAQGPGGGGGARGRRGRGVPGRQVGTWHEAGTGAHALPTAGDGAGSPTLSAGTWREEAALGWWGPREGAVSPSWLCQEAPTGCSPQRSPWGLSLCLPQPHAGVPSPAELSSGLSPASCDSARKAQAPWPSGNGRTCCNHTFGGSPVPAGWGLG